MPYTYKRISIRGRYRYRDKRSGRFISKRSVSLRRTFSRLKRKPYRRYLTKSVRFKSSSGKNYIRRGLYLSIQDDRPKILSILDFLFKKALKQKVGKITGIFFKLDGYYLQMDDDKAHIPFYSRTVSALDYKNGKYPLSDEIEILAKMIYHSDDLFSVVRDSRQREVIDYIVTRITVSIRKGKRL